MEINFSYADWAHHQYPGHVASLRVVYGSVIVTVVRDSVERELEFAADRACCRWTSERSVYIDLHEPRSNRTTELVVYCESDADAQRLREAIAECRRLG